MSTQAVNSPAVDVGARLGRLLGFIERDAGNLALRKDAIREACEVGLWDVARQLIDTGLRLHPQDSELLAMSGFDYLHAQRYSDAENALSAAIQLGQQAAEVTYNLAFAQFMQKRYTDALELLSAPDIVPVLPLALLLRARCLHHLSRPTEAIADCRAHLLVAAEDAPTHGLLALILYEQGYGEAAREHAAAALQYNAQQLEAMLTQASMQFDAQQYDAARMSFSTLLQAHSQCGRAWLGLALIELTGMRIEAARVAIEAAAVHLAEHVGTWHVLAWVQIMRGDVQAAHDAFETALQLNRNFSETHGGLAIVAVMQGRDEEARSAIKRALRLDANAMSPLYAQMLLLQREGRQGEGQELLEKFLSRPIAGTGSQYRDLVRIHMSYSRAGNESFAESARVLH